MQTAQIKITYAGIILLDHGEKMPSLPSFPGSGDAEAAAGDVELRTYDLRYEQGTSNL